jgi:DNA-binding transcriptional ArsR family regulator
MVKSVVPLHPIEDAEPSPDEHLDRVFFALADPVRRRILERLETAPLLVSELAQPFAISLQAVSRHIQMLVRAGLVRQERSGRISRCSLELGPVMDAALWINRYSKYWQSQFDLLGSVLTEIAEQQAPPAPKTARKRRAPARQVKTRHVRKGASP